MYDSLGLKRGTVRLSEHDPRWGEVFQEEKEALKKALDERLLGVEHIGSTAIPGLKAKPILDLMIAIPELDNWAWIKEPLSNIGYEFRRDLRDEQGHVLFVKGPENCRTHYLKVTEHDSDFWREHILFRDYLIDHPEYKQEYQELKEQLLEEHGGDRKPYTKAKGEFVEKILGLAGYKGEIL